MTTFVSSCRVKR